MANSHDPHRPFSGSDQEKIKFPNHPFPLPSRIYTESEIEVPGFLPDIPLVRKEICECYNSVKRLDDMVGSVLKAIEDSGTENETMLVFLSEIATTKKHNQNSSGNKIRLFKNVNKENC